MISANPLHPPYLKQTDSLQIWGGIHGSSISLALSHLITRHEQPLLIITPDSPTATRLLFELPFFLENLDKKDILEFPDWETLPYDPFSPHQDIISKRLTDLYQIPNLKKGAVITSISTLMHQLAPQDYLQTHLFLLNQGDLFNIERARMRLEKSGYRCVSQVREHGEFAVRGSIIDLFPMGSSLPYRIDLFDDTIDTIRTFSPDTQRTIDKVNKIELLPAKEFPLNPESIDYFRQRFRAEFSGNSLNCSLYRDVTEGICPPGIEYYLPLFFEKTVSLLDYLPQNTLIVSIGDTHQKSAEFWQDIKLRYEQRSNDILRPILKPQQLFISTSDIFNQINQFKQIRIQSAPLDEHPTHIHFSTKIPPAFSPLSALEIFLKNYPGRVLFCAETSGRREVLLQLLHSVSLFPKTYDSWHAFLNDTAPLGITVAALDDGFIIEQPDIALITETQL